MSVSSVSMCPTPGGGSSSSLAFVVNNPQPVIDTILPNTVTVGAAAFSLTVNGLGFVSSSVVNIDASPRTTHFVTANQLAADLLAGDANSVTTHTITVINPTPGGGTSGGATLTIASQPNPTPTITSHSSLCFMPTLSAFTLTINGASFVSGATATFGGTSVTTNFSSASVLTASIPSNLLSATATNDVVAVVVTNPAPGGGPSSTANFGLATQGSTLSGNVQPLFTASCATASCHVTGSSTAPMSLQSGKAYGNLVGVTSSGCSSEVRVIACGPLRSQSVLVDKILATSTSPACSGNPMPKGAPLNAMQRQLIVDWVAQGALNN